MVAIPFGSADALAVDAAAEGIVKEQVDKFIRAAANVKMDEGMRRYNVRNAQLMTGDDIYNEGRSGESGQVEATKTSAGDEQWKFGSQSEASVEMWRTRLQTNKAKRRCS